MSLHGRTVLVPRGGAWGQEVAQMISARGGRARVVPLIETPLVDSQDLRSALSALADGDYDWVVTTSAAAAPVLAGVQVRARVATVGPASAAALSAVGLEVALLPETDFSAAGLLRAMSALNGVAGTAIAGTRSAGASVLVLRSDLARAELIDGLRAMGHAVDPVIAYRTRNVAVDPRDAEALAAGAVDAALVTSGSVARALATLDVAAGTQVACLGPVTADDARAAGLGVDVVAAQHTIEALLDALCEPSSQEDS